MFSEELTKLILSKSNFGDPGPTLDQRVHRALKTRKLLQLKKGLYMTSRFYVDEPHKSELAEFAASQIYTPSYLSLEYVLQKHNLMNPATHSSDEPFADQLPFTSVTRKSTRSFKNFLGEFRYANLKESLFCGFQETHFHEQKYFRATKAKALFDYFYLHSNLLGNMKFLKSQLFENLGIQWQHFTKQDYDEFDKYVWKSNSFKMMKILRVIDEYFQGKEFRTLAKELRGF